MTITIRPAVESDLPSLLALFAELHPADPPLPAAQAIRVWRDMAAQPGRSILLATLDDAELGDAAVGDPTVGDAVVGTVDCAVLPNLTRGGRPFMLVENVVVAAVARRHGVGRRLLAAAVAVARSSGCYKVQLMSRAERTQAHTFYESSGFRAMAAGYRLYLDQQHPQL